MEDTLVVLIVESIAHADGVPPEELDYRIQDHVDVDAITELAAHESSEWELTFCVPDHQIRVTSSGVVYVDDVPFEASPTSSE